MSLFLGASNHGMVRRQSQRIDDTHHCNICKNSGTTYLLHCKKKYRIPFPLSSPCHLLGIFGVSPWLFGYLSAIPLDANNFSRLVPCKEKPMVCYDPLAVFLFFFLLCFLNRKGI